MECQPPRGYPEPTVMWKKNDMPIKQTGSRFQVNDGGNLLINDVRQSDAGSYICVAESLVGKRESNTVTLSVHVKPHFIKPPEDITALATEMVVFECKVAGDPQPIIIWRKQDGKMPVGRAQIQDDKGLRIQRVTPADEGIYICQADNNVGSIEASATLSVHSRPSFLVTPRDQRVSLNNAISFECVTTGNPPPAVFWTKEGSQVLMFPGQPHGRFSVSSDGELRISSVKKEDAGYYVCSALSVAGSSIAKAYLEVSAAADLPPPIIRQGPANQTLALSSVAMLPCQASGNPGPSIRWYKNNGPILANDPRVTLLDSGTLQISDLRSSDSGHYTCVASSDIGETSWGAFLSVEAPTNPAVVFHRTPDISTFPSPPSKPFITNITETSVKLTWRPTGNQGASPVIGYTVEYFSYDQQTGWVITANRVNMETYVVHNLRPDTSYMFLVRGENSHGLSLPSPVSDAVRTMGVRRQLPDYELDEVRMRLSGEVVRLREVKVLSSTAVKLSWETLKSSEFIEGYYIKFRCLDESVPKYNMVTLLNGDANSHVVMNLQKFSKYEFFVVPFYKTVEGQPSNIKIGSTLEDVPSAPPENIKVRMINLTAIRVYWSPPPPEHHNGNIRGYQLHLLGGDSRYHDNVTTNASTMSAILYNLTTGMLYQIKIAALTGRGVGVFNSPIPIRLDESLLKDDDSLSQRLQDIVKEPWFIGTLGGILFLLLFIFCLMLYIRRRKARKKSVNGHLNVPVHKAGSMTRANINARDALWIDHGWRPQDSENKESNLKDNNLINKLDCPSNDLNCTSAPDYAEVDTRNMKTFYKKDTTSPAPYATTTLVSSVQKKLNRPNVMGDKGFIPINQRKDSKCSGSDDSCMKPDASSDTNTDNSRANTEACMDQSDAEKVASPMSDASSMTTDEHGFPVHRKKKQVRPPPKQPVLNWADLLPPPPEHPPPSDIGSPPDTPPRSPVTRGFKQMSCRSPASPATSRHYEPTQDKILYPSRNFQYSYADNKRQSPRSIYSQITANDNDRIPTPPIRGCGYKMVTIGDHPGMIPMDIGIDRGPTPPARTFSSSPPSPSGPLMDRAIQSSLPSLISEPHPLPARLEVTANGPQLSIDLSGAYRSGVDSPTSEGLPGYGDVERVLRKGARTPESSIGDFEGSVTGSMLASWASVTDNSNSSCTSARSSGASSSDGSFFTEADFASAVARAAEGAGLSVVGSVVSDPSAVANGPVLPEGQRGALKDRKNLSLKLQQSKPRPPHFPVQQLAQDDIPAYSKPSFPSRSSPSGNSSYSSSTGRKKRERGAALNTPPFNSMSSSMSERDYNIKPTPPVTIRMDDKDTPIV